MIVLTRISGQSFVLNCDLIERVDSTPDTVVSLVDGKKYVVTESLEDVTRAVRRHRSEIIAQSHVFERELEEEHSRPIPLPTGSVARAVTAQHAGELTHGHLSTVTPLHPED